MQKQCALQNFELLAYNAITIKHKKPFVKLKRLKIYTHVIFFLWIIILISPIETHTQKKKILKIIVTCNDQLHTQKYAHSNIKQEKSN